MGSLSVTWDEHYRAPFAPLIPGVTFADAGDPASLAGLVDGDTAAIIVEPIQGEGGVRPISPALAEAIRTVCQRTGALLIADEVQSGSFRTGTFLASPEFGLTPDLVALGKALGAGVPIGAAMLSASIAGTVGHGDHGTTYGGNLLACRAALVFLDTVEGGLLDSLVQTSEHLFTGLRALAAKHPQTVTAGTRRRPHGGTGARDRCDAGRQRRARARVADQSHVDDRGADAAAVHRDDE